MAILLYPSCFFIIYVLVSIMLVLVPVARVQASPIALPPHHPLTPFKPFRQLHLPLNVPNPAAPLHLPLTASLQLINKRQAVTDAIAPEEPLLPGCVRRWSGTFGVAILNVTSREGGGAEVDGDRDSGNARSGGGADGRGSEGRVLLRKRWFWGNRHAQIEEGEGDSTPNTGPTTPTPVLLNPVSQIFDGQIQAPTAPITLLPPDVPSATPVASVITLAQVSQIADGQVQGGMHTVELVAATERGSREGGGEGGGGGSGRVMYMPAGASFQTPATPIPSPAVTGDGESIMNIAGTPSTDRLSSSDRTTSLAPPSDSPSGINSPADNASPSNDNATTLSKLEADDSPVALVACLAPSTLTLSLSDGILTDSLGRTGYIASNYQFQFDSPPQSEALFTSGWSVCGTDEGIVSIGEGGEGGGLRLALGNQTTFWQCLSGEFYNLYDRGWAAQCGEVSVTLVELVDC